MYAFVDQLDVMSIYRLVARFLSQRMHIKNRATYAFMRLLQFAFVTAVNEKTRLPTGTGLPSVAVLAAEIGRKKIWPKNRVSSRFASFP